METFQASTMNKMAKAEERLEEDNYLNRETNTNNDCRQHNVRSINETISQ